MQERRIAAGQGVLEGRQYDQCAWPFGGGGLRHHIQSTLSCRVLTPKGKEGKGEKDRRAHGLAAGGGRAGCCAGGADHHDAGAMMLVTIYYI